ncbi:MAG TPA: hypothetical protein VFY10_06615 [Dehalococcoidia bacterium]|nr:hypothetical protein [Dehalococcoidia bacterium]
MSGYFSSESLYDTRLEPASRARLLDSVRWVEVAALSLSSLIAAISIHYGVLLATPLLLIAFILVPRDRVAVEKQRASERASLVNQVRQEGYQLRSVYMAVRGQALSGERTRAQASARRGIVQWISSTNKKLETYPEFAGIFQAHRSSGGIIAELDCCLQRLSELRQLGLLSDRLELPI